MGIETIIRRNLTVTLLLVGALSSATTWYFLSGSGSERRIAGLEGQAEELRFHISQLKMAKGKEAAHPAYPKGPGESLLEGVSYEVPKGWISMSKIEVAVFNEASSALGEVAQLVRGHKPHLTKAYNRPYILVQADSTSTTLNALYAGTQRNWKASSDRVADVVSRTGHELSSTDHEVDLDEESGLVWARMKDEKGFFRVLSASKPTSGGWIGLIGYYDINDRERIEEERIKRVFLSLKAE